MHWLTRHLLSERQVPLLLAPLFFIVYGFILTMIWQNGIDLFTCLGFTIAYMVVDYFATLRRYEQMLGVMPIAKKKVRLVSYQYIGLMSAIYYVLYSAFFFISELYFNVFSMEQRMIAMLVSLCVILFVINILIIIDVWIQSSFAAVALLFCAFLSLLSNAPQMISILEGILWWQVALAIMVAFSLTSIVWHYYPKRLSLKDVKK